MPAQRSSKPQGPKRSGSSSGRRQAGARADAKPGAGKRPGDRKPASGGPAKRKKQREQPFAVNEREQHEGVRLQKFMASAGVSSRRKAEELIERGAVQINGRVVKELGVRVFPGRDRVTVNGEPIEAETKVYYVLNKPDQIVSSAAGSVDERGRPTVLSLMHGIPQRLYPVGRLDYHSRGVMLLTNDGVLAEALTHPRHGVVKTYHVKFQGKLTPEEEEQLRGGIELDDGAVTRPLVELFPFRETETNVWYQIGLTEGLNRQIRRMGDAIGRPVLKLIRVAIGDITADGLAEGEFRALTSTEVAQLLDATAPRPTHAGKSSTRTGGTQPPRRSAGAESSSEGKPAARASSGARRAGPTGKPPARGKPSTRSGEREGDRARTRRDGEGGRTSRDGEGGRARTSRAGERPREGGRARASEDRPHEPSRSRAPARAAEGRSRTGGDGEADRGRGERPSADRRRAGASAGKRRPDAPRKPGPGKAGPKRAPAKRKK